MKTNSRSEKWLFSVAVLLGMSTGASAQSYNFVDLGGGASGVAFTGGINDVGQVAGYSRVPQDVWTVAEVWTTTTATVLPNPLVGYGKSWGASDINNAGQAVGYANTGLGENNNPPFVQYAATWNGTTPTLLGTMGGSGGQANGINNSGQIVGSLGGSAVIWNGTTPTILGGPGSGANDINDSGQVVGSTGGNAVIWNVTTPTILGTLGGSGTQALRINDPGQAVGYSTTTGGAQHATMWNGSSVTDLGGTFSQSQALDINDLGQVVGYSKGTSGVSHATIWNGTVATDLNTFLSASELSAGWVLNTATGINDKGWIVGTATCGSFVVCGVYSDAFVLMPVPEPEGYALALAGMGVVGFAARRRRVLGFLS